MEGVLASMGMERRVIFNYVVKYHVYHFIRIIKLYVTHAIFESFIAIKL